MYPSYGGMPNCDDGDDDLGLLLTVLLFAAKQRSNSFDRYGYGGCGCCNNCCRSTQKTIPIPYPIPIPTNNPIIYKSQSSENDSDTDDCNDDTAQGSQKSSQHESSEEEETTSTTSTCFGQPSNFFNQNNFGKKPLGTPAPQSSPNTSFLKNFTGHGNIGNTANFQGSQQLPGNNQESNNPLNARNTPPEQPFNFQQSMALQKMNMQSLTNLQQQPNNLPKNLPGATPYNTPVPANMPSLSLSEPVQNYNILSAPAINPLQGQQMSYQLPSQTGMPMQYSLQTPQAIPSYSVNSNYGIPSTPGCSTPVTIPLGVMEASQMYSPAPSFNPYSFSQPSVSNYYPSFDPSQSIMIGQNDIILNTQDPLSSAYLPVLQTSSPQYRVVQSYPVNTIVTSDLSQNSKSSTLKTILPLLINLLKERNSCPCHPGCDCECKKKRAKKPQISSSYSKQKKYPLSEDGPAIEIYSDEMETTRNVREPKLAGKLKNKIPDVSTEAQDDESLEYHEEDDNEDESK
ncbi:unnamed protein product [Colias eurytheme]|nr:unnamed protein product [Colias eurytheme]